MAENETKLPLRDKIAALVRSETSASGSYENCPYKEAWLEVADRILALVAEQSEDDGLSNDAAFLFMLADGADEPDDEADDNQTLWPETKENLLAISAKLRSLATKQASDDATALARMKAHLSNMIADCRQMLKEEPHLQNRHTGVPVAAIACKTLIEGLSITLEGGDYRDVDTANEWADRNRR